MFAFFLSLYTVLFTHLLCIISPASYGKGNPALLHPSQVPAQAHLRVSQGIPWSAHALGGSGPTCSFAWSWEAERRWEGGREASPRLRAVKALAHLSTAQSHRQAAAFLPRFAWSRYPHFSLLLVIYISRGQTPLHSAPFAACQTPIHSSQPLSSIVLKLPLAIFNCQNIYICHLHTKCIH